MPFNYKIPFNISILHFMGILLYLNHRELEWENHSFPGKWRLTAVFPTDFFNKIKLKDVIL